MHKSYKHKRIDQYLRHRLFRFWFNVWFTAFRQRRFRLTILGPTFLCPVTILQLKHTQYHPRHHYSTLNIKTCQYFALRSFSLSWHCSCLIPSTTALTKKYAKILPKPLNSYSDTDLHFLSPQPDTSSHCKTMGLVHREVCLFTSQLPLVHTALTHGGMARLSWPPGWLVTYRNGLRTGLLISTHHTTNVTGPVLITKIKHPILLNHISLNL